MGDAGTLKGWDAALRSMRKGERARFAFAPAEAYGANGDDAVGVAAGATVEAEIEVVGLVEVEDVSAAGDRSVLKLPIEAGRGVETPRRGAKCAVRLSVATDNGTVLNATAGDEPLRLSLDGTDLGVGLRQASSRWCEASARACARPPRSRARRCCSTADRRRWPSTSRCSRSSSQRAWATWRRPSCWIT